MSSAIDVFEKSLALLAEHDTPVESRRTVPESSLLRLEERLGVRLPPSYRMMIQNFGLLYFGSVEIYGVTSSGFDGRGAPNVVFMTESERQNGRITDQMVHFMDAGYGPSFVLDCSQPGPDGEVPVLEVAPGGIKNGTDRLSNSFGEFLLQEVLSYLDLDGIKDNPPDVIEPDSVPTPEEIAAYWKQRANDFKK